MPDLKKNKQEEPLKHWKKLTEVHHDTLLLFVSHPLTYIGLHSNLLCSIGLFTDISPFI